MKDLIESIFGVYTPVMTESELSDGTIVSVVADGAAGVDWAYILGVLGFFLVVYCILRIIGGIICHE